MVKMILESTVLILGAGASCSLGFPTGKELFNHISGDSLLPGIPRIAEKMVNCGFSPSDLEAFAKELKYSGLSSVDQFLEYRPEWINYGKHVIAASLLPLERMETLFHDSVENPNWYKVLYGRLNAPFERFAENKLTVITYNYDRSLEQFLVTSLKNSHNKSGDACAAIIDKIPVIHIHGQFSSIFEPVGKVVEYGAEAYPAHIKLSASNIRIIHEPIDKDPVFVRAHEALKQAQKIAFLGFGYHKTNLERLIPEGLMRGYRPTVYASVLGFGLAEREAIGAHLKKCFPSSEVLMGKPGLGINDMLHDYPLLPLF